MEQIVNGKEIHKLKAKDSEILATQLCSENIRQQIIWKKQD